jgi:hypothetical protein
MTAPNIYPTFYRFATVVGVFLGVAVGGVALGLAALAKIFGPKQEEE